MEKKEIKKTFNKIIKEIGREYGYSKKSFCLYKRLDNDIFIVINFFASDNFNQMTLRGMCKPYLYDNILWTVFDMASNIDESDGLRADGAFAAPSYTIAKTSLDISTNMETSCRAGLKDIFEQIEQWLCVINNDPIEFSNYVISEKPQQYQGDLLLALAYIHLKQYEAVKEFVRHELQKKNGGGMINKTTSIFEYMLNYDYSVYPPIST